MASGAALVVSLSAAVLLFAAMHDIAFRTIPNWVSGTLAIGGVAARALDGEWLSGILCGFAIFGLAAACWSRGWLGGGDVKLLGAGALLVRPVLVPSFVLMVSLAGGALALAYLLLERCVPECPLRRQASWLRRIATVECRRIRRRASLPYAAAIAAAAIFMMIKN